MQYTLPASLAEYTARTDALWNEPRVFFARLSHVANQLVTHCSFLTFIDICRKIADALLLCRTMHDNILITVMTIVIMTMHDNVPVPVQCL